MGRLSAYVLVLATVAVQASSCASSSECSTGETERCKCPNGGRYNGCNRIATPAVLVFGTRSCTTEGRWARCSCYGEVVPACATEKHPMCAQECSGVVRGTTFDSPPFPAGLDADACANAIGAAWSCSNCIDTPSGSYDFTAPAEACKAQWQAANAACLGPSACGG